MLSELGTDGSESCRKVQDGIRVADATISLVNPKSLQYECTRILDDSLLVLVLLYGSNAMVCREKEISRVRTVLMR